MFYDFVHGNSHPFKLGLNCYYKQNYNLIMENIISLIQNIAKGIECSSGVCVLGKSHTVLHYEFQFSGCSFNDVVLMIYP